MGRRTLSRCLGLRGSLLLICGSPPGVTFWPCIAQQPAPADATPATIEPERRLSILRSTAREVSLDVIILDSRGQPVRDLQPSDFVIREDGIEQRARLVESPQDGATRAGANITTPAEPNQADSRPAKADGAEQFGPSEKPSETRRRTLILLDEVNVKFFDLAFARNRLEKFLSSRQAAGEPIALMAITPTRLLLVHDFTTEQPALQKALHDLPPAIPAAGGMRDVDENRDTENFTRAMGALATIAHSLQGSTVRTNCVWITSGFLSMAKMQNSSEEQVNFDSMMRRASNLYLDARMAVFTIDPHGVEFETSLPNINAQPYQGPVDYNAFRNTTGSQFAAQAQLNLTSTSAVIDSLLGQFDARTGGRSFSNQNDIDVPLGEVLEESRGNYLFSYAPLDKNFHGEYRKIRVELKRPGLHAMARDGYVASAESTGRTEKEARQLLTAALESPLPYIALRIHAELGDLKQRPVLRVSVEAPAVEWATLANGEAQVEQEIAVAVFSANNQPLFNNEWKVTTARGDLSSNRTLQYVLPFKLPARAGRVRVAVLDRNGTRMGSTDVDLSRQEAAGKQTTPALPALP